MDILKKCAEILVGCGYAETYGICQATIHLEPFADTLEGRRQLDAIEDWLYKNKYKLLTQGRGVSHPLHEYRLSNIKRCIQELANNE